jgi:hypothetical protein
VIVTGVATNELLQRVRIDHLAWINGDCSGYELTDETSTILGALGGSIIGASTATPGQRRAVQQFESGSGIVELLNVVCQATSRGWW